MVLNPPKVRQKTFGGRFTFESRYPCGVVAFFVIWLFFSFYRFYPVCLWFICSIFVTLKPDIQICRYITE